MGNHLGTESKIDDANKIQSSLNVLNMMKKISDLKNLDNTSRIYLYCYLIVYEMDAQTRIKKLIHCKGDFCK